MDNPTSIDNYTPKPKPIVYTEDPYSYNSVAFKRGLDKVELTQSAAQLVADPLYNSVGKALGIDMAHDWNKYYDKVFKIVEWAKLRSGKTEITEILDKINSLHNESPNLASKKIDNLYLMASLQMSGAKDV